MRQAKRRKTLRSQVSAVRTIPAPVGGWNARDQLADMKETEAVALENLFPGTSYVEGRGGYSSHATGLTGNGKTLAVYNALAGTSKMFCMTSSGVYDVSSAGAVGASVAARTNGKHQCFMFGDGSSNWLICLNGVDEPLYYDGTTWTAVTGATSPALTGVTTTDLISGFVSKGRIYFIQKASLSFWYLTAGVAGGALTEFDLSGEATKGGYLVAGASWTLDAGDGVDDYVAFVTSEGEAIIYRGTNPSSIATWGKVGTFFIGSPLGRRCMTRYGADVVVLTENGAFPLSAALQSASVDSKLALSFKIEPVFTSKARSTGDVFGWESIVFSPRSALIVNVPTAEDGVHEQYVMNTITKAWCKFTNWNAETFAVFAKQLYFADGTAVYKAWNGTDDNNSNIVMYGKQAFSYFNMRGVEKHFKLYRPVFAANGTFSFLTDMDIDFRDTTISGSATYTVVNGAVWDVDMWDVGYWAAGLDVVKEWTSPAQNVGYCAAGKIKITTQTLTVQWMASDYIFETGGPL